LTAPGTQKPRPKVRGWWKYDLPSGSRRFPCEFPFVLGSQTKTVTANFTGSGGFGANQLANAVLSGSGALSAEVLELQSESGLIPAEIPFLLGTENVEAGRFPAVIPFNVAGAQRRTIAAALSGAGTLTATAAPRFAVAAALSGDGALSATASTIGVISSASNSFSASRSPAITFPSTWTPRLNDLVIVFPSSTTAATITDVSGWTNPLGSGVDVESDVHQISCGYHFVTAGEVTAETRSWTLTNWYDANETGNIVGCVISGAATSGTVDSINSKSDTANTATPHSTAVLLGTNLTTGSLVLSCTASDGTNTYAADPAGWIRIITDNTSQGKILMQRVALTTANSDVDEVSFTPADGDEFVSITIAITD